MWISGYTHVVLTSPDHMESVAEVFKAVGEPIRVRIVAMLAHGELCVCHIHSTLEEPQPTVSRHLSVLRRAGVVRGRRAGSWVYYELTPLAEKWLVSLLVEARADADLGQRCRAAKSCS